ncbi:hypothetical protein F0562_009298 [Nyssa sinensis]|uniref:Fatty acid desaturase domain-containing protein n=1 Tax=Nyssa sinensis TaxID=561372 RepID=A0A5J4ZVT3_9ASTE|nr:hypothetical protein F0562_009298 [Nyssa sinensis]
MFLIPFQESIITHKEEYRATRPTTVHQKHVLVCHFDSKKFRPHEVKRVKNFHIYGNWMAVDCLRWESWDGLSYAQAQLNGTVHYDYPRWIEILCHDIDVHIPHHISPMIPSYNLRAAHQCLQEKWVKSLNEAAWNWRLMKAILTMCHVYSKEKNYLSFDELAPKDSYPITFLKKAMPDYA